MNQTATSDLVARRAITADLSFVAWCNFEASSPAPGFCYWDPLLEGLNTETMAFIEAMFACDGLAWGRVTDFFIVQDGSELIAGASGFQMNPNDYRPLRLEQLPKIAERLGWDESAQASFLQRYNAVWNDPKDVSLEPHAPWIIECFAVIPERRGQGVAQILLEAIENEGERLGHSHVGISVTAGNEAAQKAYEKAGFNMHLSYGADYFENAFPGTIKYRKSLQNC
jgi:ribosomal protein S18 acetylase RimI-like enzyme